MTDPIRLVTVDYTGATFHHVWSAAVPGWAGTVVLFSCLVYQVSVPGAALPIQRDPWVQKLRTPLL